MEGKDGDEAVLVQLEMELRDRVRTKLNMPRRPTRKTISPSDHAKSLGIDPSPDLLLSSNQAKHHDKKLQSLKWPDVLDATLSKINDDARLAEQEMGLSTLFLVFGFLEWYENDDSTKHLMAPLLLLPVRLDRRNNNRGRTIYSLIATAEGPETNLSLEKRIERDFGRQLPQFIADEDNLGSVNEYLRSVSVATEGLKRWKVRPWLMLGHFGFGRLAMYTDLSPERWPLPPISNNLIKAILHGTDKVDGGEFTLEPPDDYAIEDPEIEKIAPFLIHDADASQHSALVDALKGKNLVIHGPPGTGKSQTITNLIANALAMGKRVLFLAEKQAALEVVKRRLDTAGLGKFCLELHSDRVAPRRIIESLKSRHELGYSGIGIQSADTEGTLRQLRSELNTYFGALHEKSTNGRSIFDNIWASIRAETSFGDAFLSIRAMSIPKHLLMDDSALGKVRDSLSLYGAVKQAYEADFGPASESPLSLLGFGSSAHQGVFVELKSDIESLSAKAQKLASLADTIARHGVADREDAEAAIAVCDLLPGEVPDSGVLKRALKFAISQLRSTSTTASLLQEVERKLLPEFSSKTLSEASLTEILALYRDVGETHFANVPLHLLSAEAIQAVDWAAACKQIVADTEPLIRAAGYDDASVNEVMALVYAAKFLGALPAETIGWFAWANNRNESTILSAYSHWARLLSERRSWIKRFPHCRRFPEVSDLHEVSTLLRKNALVRAFGTLAGNAKRINALAVGLGLAEGEKLNPEELDKFAAFLSDLREFESSESYGELLGSLWQGLKTPLDFINSATNNRLVLRQKLNKLESGAEIFDKLDHCSDEELKILSNLSNAVPDIRSEHRSRFGVERIGTVLERARKEADTAHRILAAVLPNFEKQSGSLKLLSEQAELELVRRRESEILQSSSVYQADPELFLTEKANALKLATDWIEVAERHIRKPILRDAVLSVQSESELQQLFDSTASYLQAVEEVEAGIEKVRIDHDVRGLDGFEPKALTAFLKRILEKPGELRAYLDLNSHRHSVAKSGLDEFLKRSDVLKGSTIHLVDLLDAIVAWRRADHERKVSPVLSRASGVGLEARRSDFTSRDRQKINADRKTVANRLTTLKPPSGSSVGPRKRWTEMALINNEFGKERRFAPVRDLITRASRAIQILKPCFMMSPLSLAKYLPATKLDFDLLIVDEASQMRPEDALGALMRVKQLVVVGDSKQLPPTDFFHRSEEDVGDSYEEESLDDESILEACQKTFGQTRMLRWHYRSRCESLIAFSNREFYENALITFPSPEPQAFSVDLVRVNGSYKAGCNLQEAQRIAEEAIAFMRHFSDAEASDIPTIGLVAINTKQRDLIFEELRQLESGDEKVERYRERVAAKGEPVFVKNLENVQGDERDFILISLTYGPEVGQTVVAQRFGPIGTKQGHRRLNVLFSRARVRIGLFTSMGSDDVRPSDTSSEGARVLKRYLEYAERRGKGEYQNAGGDSESDFELEVAARLRSKGYQVETQIGVSGYRIDLGIRDPKNPALFLAGVECDGATYHSSKSARERDRLREEILKGLGWRILRVWSTDWFDDPSVETDKLCQKIEALRGSVSTKQPRDYEFLRIEPETKSPLEPVELIAINTAQRPLEAAIRVSPSKASDGLNSALSSQIDHHDLAILLRQFREDVIAREMPDWEPQRSILRDGMIETLIAQRITDPGDWFRKVPLFQRMGTNPAEKAQYLGRVCELIDQHSISRPMEHS